MNKDEIKGKINDAKGRVERQVGEWTGDSKTQAEGLGDQIKGKAQKGLGKVKDAGDRMMRDVRERTDREGSDVRDEEGRDRKVA